MLLVILIIYINDLENIDYLHDSSECIDDINISINDFETKVSHVIDHHFEVQISS